MSTEIPPPPLGPNWNAWGERINSFLIRTRDRLRHQVADEKATDDGILMWDRSGPYPVVSLDGEWRQIVVANGYAFLFQDADITAAASNTAYPIVFDTPAAGYASRIYLGASPNQSRIYFEEGGLYSLNFTAQIYSTKGSTLGFWFWPRINGVDVPSGTTKATLHDNGQTKPVTKGAIFSVEAGDYLEAIWATDDHTVASLEAFAATAFAPATPSVSLSISRVQA
jgi:hypothetical protein